MPKTNRGCSNPYITSVSSLGAPILSSAAKWGASNKPRSFPDTEAETPISKPPYAQNCSHADQLFVYSALFASPVKTISSAALI